MLRALGYGFAAVGITLPLFFSGACGSSGGNGGQSGEGGADGTSSGSSSGSASSSGGGSGGSSSSGGGSGGGSGSSSGGSGAGASVLQFHNHINRDGVFVDSKLTEAAVASMHLDTTFAGTISGNVYASPLYVENGVGGKGTFYVATESNSLVALDEATGAVKWTTDSTKLGTPVTSPPCGNIAGNGNTLGITGTPAIDLASRLIVLDAAVADGSGNIGSHTVYGLSIDDGSVKWKVDVSTLSANGVTFSPPPQNERGAVLIVGGIAYVVYGGHYGDCGNYHGWVVGVPLSGTGAKGWATQVQGAGIWGPGGAASDGQSIYVTTGNGFNSGATWAESEGVFRLDPGPSYAGASADYFAPGNWLSLDQGDVDMSGSGPLVIDAPSMTPSTLVLAQGKDGNLYLLDRTNLGGIGTAKVGTLQVLGGEITNAGAWATIGGTTYVVVRPNQGGSGIGCPNGTSGDLVAVKLDPTAAAAQKMSVVWCADAQGEGSPSITSSDGTHDPMVWTAGAESSNRLHSWDLVTGNAVFKGGTASDAISKVRRFTTPIAVHGRIFVGGDNRLYAFTL